VIVMTSTDERVCDEKDLEALDVQRELTAARPASPTRRLKTRRLRVAGFVIAATVAGFAGNRWIDQRPPTHTPPWVEACQHAIDATARVHRLEATQVAQGLDELWARVAGADISDPTSVDTSLNARLQRDADDATGRCISPSTPLSDAEDRYALQVTSQ
jgi:hypothetical protein